VPVRGYSPRGMDVDGNGVVWAPLASGHLASFDRRKCRGPLNGPTATGKQCPEGWTLYPFPARQFKGLAQSGSAEASYYTWVDRFNTLGLGQNVPMATGNLGESVVALVNKSFVVMRVPYPLGFFAKNVDGRIDDPHAGWRAVVCGTTFGSRRAVPYGNRQRHEADGATLPSETESARGLSADPARTRTLRSWWAAPRSEASTYKTANFPPPHGVSSDKAIPALSPAGTAGQFGELLRRYRLAAGFSQEFLAERARIEHHGSQYARARRATGSAARNVRDVGEGARTLGIRPYRTRSGGGSRPFARFATGLRALRPEKEDAAALVADNLPTAMTSLVGRDDDIRTLLALFIVNDIDSSRLQARGGVGKSRLAIETARALTGTLRDGVWIVELAPVADPQLVAATIASVLGVACKALDPHWRRYSALFDPGKCSSFSTIVSICLTASHMS